MQPVKTVQNWKQNWTNVFCLFFSFLSYSLLNCVTILLSLCKGHISGIYSRSSRWVMEISQHLGKCCRNALASKANPFRWIIYILRMWEQFCANYLETVRLFSTWFYKPILQKVEDFPKLFILSKKKKNLQKWLMHRDWFRIWCLETLSCAMHTHKRDKIAPVHSINGDQLTEWIPHFTPLGPPADHKHTWKSHSFATWTMAPF